MKENRPHALSEYLHKLRV